MTGVRGSVYFSIMKAYKKAIKVFLFSSLLILLPVISSSQILKNEVTLDLVKDCADCIYDLKFTEANDLLDRLSKYYPDHPALDLIKGMIIYWQNFPLTSLSPERKSFEEQLKKSRAEQASKKQQIEADLDRYVQEIEAQKAARLELVAAIKPEVLINYDKLREAKNGLAVVITKNELCMGCNMKIPPQSYNQVITSDEIIYCPNCRRMLYIASESEQTECTGREPGRIKQTA